MKEPKRIDVKESEILSFLADAELAHEVRILAAMNDMSKSELFRRAIRVVMDDPTLIYKKVKKS